jgi:PleD family two-component response regulator
MVMNIHSDASYLSEPNARSRACGHFFHGRITERWKANQIKWHFSYAVFNITICCGVSSGIKTWSTISQLPRRNDI